MRERIVAWTSTRNECSFCAQVHSAVATNLSQDRLIVDVVCRNPQTAPVSEREKALLLFLAKVNDAPSSGGRGDFEAASPEPRWPSRRTEGLPSAVTIRSDDR